MGPKDHNTHTCPVRGCSWRLAPNGRCPDHHVAAIENPNYGHADGDRRVMEARYRVIGYVGCPQEPISCKTLRDARIQRDLNGGRIVDANDQVVH